VNTLAPGLVGVQPHPVPLPRQQQPTPAPRVEPEDTGPNLALEEWLHHRVKGIRPFIGFTLAGGVVNGGYSGAARSAWGSGADGAFLFALRGGVFLGPRHELALEVSPFTDVWDTQAPGPTFQVNGTYGYWLPLVQGETVQLSWPLRVGAGVMIGGSNTGNNVFFQGRADLIGIALKVGHLIIEGHLPSFRYALTNGRFPGFGGDGVTQHVLTWFIGTSVSYVL
jgi:hypothetical protein